MQDDIIRDYRKWLAFNNTLTDQQHISDLYQAAKNKRTTGVYEVETIDSEQGLHYRITDNVYSALEINDNSVAAFLDYINKHYTLASRTETVEETNTIAPTIPKGASPFTHSNALPRSDNFFLNENIVLHAVGYVIIGFIIGQAFVLPQFFNLKLPDYFRWIFLAPLIILCHIAVKNYKKHFLLGGIRYGTVAKITITIFGLIFAGFSFEVIVVDLFSKGQNLNLIVVIMTGIIMVVAGLASGWFVSLFVYFSNGGKIVTDPTTIKKKE
jgi:hypothetical protein